MSRASPEECGTTASGGGAVLPGTRAWFVLLVVWMAALCGGAVFLLRYYDASSAPLALRVWILLLMCFYLTLCNSFVPLPTAWIVLLAARGDYAVVPLPWLNVVLVALLATCATVVANLTEYHLLAWLLRFRLGARIRRARLVAWAARWFSRSPFQILILVAFIPIPIDAVRWLAILQHYPRTRFALAYFLGRGPRYLIFAAGSVLLALGGREILLIQVGLVAAGLLGRLVWRVVRRRRPVAEVTLAAAVGEQPAPAA